MSEVAPQPPEQIEAEDVMTYVRFVLSHPGMSRWLKDALASAMERDPISVLNDLELLSLITRSRIRRDL